MRNLGIGVMIAELGGNKDSAKAAQWALGRRILSMELDEDSLRIYLNGDRTLTLRDVGQSCCESRYMRSDDKASDFVGAKLTGLSLRDAPDVEADGEVHEVQFLVVETDKGAFTVSNHNEHNGYYGGFAISASLSPERVPTAPKDGEP